MSLSCDIVIDLVSLFKDKLASDDSVKEIEAHLKQCPSCKKHYKYYDSINKTTNLNQSSPNLNVDNYTDRYKVISKKLRKRYTLSTTAIASLIGICAGVTILSVVKSQKYKNIIINLKK